MGTVEGPLFLFAQLPDLPMNATETFPVVDPREAARVLGVTPRTVRRRCKNGDLEAQKVGDTWAIPREEIENETPRRQVAAA